MADFHDKMLASTAAGVARGDLLALEMKAELDSEREQLLAAGLTNPRLASLATWSATRADGVEVLVRWDEDEKMCVYPKEVSCG